MIHEIDFYVPQVADASVILRGVLNGYAAEGKRCLYVGRDAHAVQAFRDGGRCGADAATCGGLERVPGEAYGVVVFDGLDEYTPEDGAKARRLLAPMAEGILITVDRVAK